MSFREALSQGVTHIAPEHLLAGLVRAEGIVADFLADWDIDLRVVRDEIKRPGYGATKGGVKVTEERMADKMENDPKIEDAVAEKLAEQYQKTHLGQQDVLSGYRAAVALVGEKVSVKIRRGPTYCGFLTALGPEVIISDSGVTHTIKIDRIEWLCKQ